MSDVQNTSGEIEAGAAMPVDDVAAEATTDNGIQPAPDITNLAARAVNNQFEIAARNIESLRDKFQADCDVTVSELTRVAEACRRQGQAIFETVERTSTRATKIADQALLMIKDLADERL